MATVRPLAVEPNWLKAHGFEELRLPPMRNKDIRSFMGAWHRAARLDGDDREHLTELEQDLAHHFTQNTALRDLARTPPALRGDKRRKIDAPEGITMDVEEQIQLLQRIAVWLVREGQSEFSREQALRQLARALPGGDEGIDVTL